MFLIQHGRRRSLLLWQRADPSHSVIVMSQRLGSHLRRDCEGIRLLRFYGENA